MLPLSTWKEPVPSPVELIAVHSQTDVGPRPARDPSIGIGKPERLSPNLFGYWCRRITDDHRLVYQLRDDELVVVQCRYHY